MIHPTAHDRSIRRQLGSRRQHRRLQHDRRRRGHRRRHQRSDRIASSAARPGSGSDNRIIRHAAIGGDPQDKKFTASATELVIGDRNTIREFTTFNRGTADGGGVTRIGDDNWIMAYVHIAHDCVGRQPHHLRQQRHAGRPRRGRRLGDPRRLRRRAPVLPDRRPRLHRHGRADQRRRAALRHGRPTSTAAPRGINSRRPQAPRLRRRAHRRDQARLPHAVRVGLRWKPSSNWRKPRQELARERASNAATPTFDSMLRRSSSVSERGHAALKPMRIALVAGEASGDQLGAGLIRQLRSALPGCGIRRHRRRRDARTRAATPGTTRANWR